ncbi:HD-GYP domain-containing protein [Roseibium salinum]
MAGLSRETVGDAQVALVDLQDAGQAGLVALKAWEGVAGIPVICLFDRKNRRELIQAGALGKFEALDRSEPVAVLLTRIRALTGNDICKALPPGLSRQTTEAYRKSNAFLESLTLSAIEGADIEVNLMSESAAEMLTALSLDGLSVWLNAVHTHHSGTYCHSLMVAGLAGMFARHLGWPEEACLEMIAGGLVHDIGKTRIPLAILDKPGKLTEKEREIINRHPDIGRVILKPRHELSVAIKKMAVQHHEYLDGSGYPDGLTGERISQDVRLMTICDIFAALTERRAYKDGAPPRVAVSIMKQMGPKLDQDMLSQFARMVLEDRFCAVKRSAKSAR